MYQIVTHNHSSYVGCSKHRSPPIMPRAELGACMVPSGVGNLISIDIWRSRGGLSVSEKGYPCVLTVVDHFNSYLYAFSIKDEKPCILAKKNSSKLSISREQIYPQNYLIR